MGIGDIKGPGGAPEPTPIGVNRLAKPPVKADATPGLGADTFTSSAEGAVVMLWATQTPAEIANSLRFHPRLLDLVGPMGIIGAMEEERKLAIAAALSTFGEEVLANKVRKIETKKKTTVLPTDPASDANPV